MTLAREMTLCLRQAPKAHWHAANLTERQQTPCAQHSLLTLRHIVSHSAYKEGLVGSADWSGAAGQVMEQEGAREVRYMSHDTLTAPGYRDPALLMQLMELTVVPTPLGLTWAGSIARSSLKKKLSARRLSPRMPWTKYTVNRRQSGCPISRHCRRAD